MITIDFENELDKKLDTYESIFIKLAAATYQYLEQTDNLNLSVTITNNETIHQYNKDYRQIDRPTDVISFAFDDYEDDIILEQLPFRTLGDIIISYDQACIQKESYGHSIEREMSFLFVHGLLHLFGYDHETKDDEKEMFNIQEVILNAEGFNR